MAGSRYMYAPTSQHTGDSFTSGTSSAGRGVRALDNDWFAEIDY